jgi:hypothetical protein
MVDRHQSVQTNGAARKRFLPRRFFVIIQIPEFCHHTGGKPFFISERYISEAAGNWISA